MNKLTYMFEADLYLAMKLKSMIKKELKDRRPPLYFGDLSLGRPVALV